jgi:hypothetical protein
MKKNVSYKNVTNLGIFGGYDRTESHNIGSGIGESKNAVI